jgi:hypothetical protein
VKNSDKILMPYTRTLPPLITTEGDPLLYFLISIRIALCAAGDKIKKNEMDGACSAYVYRVLVGKPGGRRPLGRPRRRWEYNIKMDLREVGCGCVDWMKLAQERDRWRALLSAVMNLRVP